MKPVLMDGLARVSFDDLWSVSENRPVYPHVGLWRSWERASMAWKRSSVRSRPGPPIPRYAIRLHPTERKFTSFLYRCCDTTRGTPQGTSPRTDYLNPRAGTVGLGLQGAIWHFVRGATT